MSTLTSPNSSQDTNNTSLPYDPNWAIALANRCKSLPQKDKEDFSELLTILATAVRDQDSEGVYCAIEAINEILWDNVDYKPVVYNPEVAPDKLDAWKSYISKKIKDLRTERELTQQELASLAGLTQSHVSRLESGLHSPSHETIKAIARALDVGVQVLDPNADVD